MRFHYSDPMVAAAFAALNSNEATLPPAGGSQHGGLSARALDELITAANKLEDLLKIADRRLERTQALKIVSMIADWHSRDLVKLEEFENDSRFLKLCKILGEHSK